MNKLSTVWVQDPCLKITNDLVVGPAPPQSYKKLLKKKLLKKLLKTAQKKTRKKVNAIIIQKQHN